MADIVKLLKAAKLSEELTRLRDTMRKLFGERYPEIIAVSRELIVRICTRTGRAPIDVCLRLCKRADAEGDHFKCPLLIAAAVDLAEEG